MFLKSKASGYTAEQSEQARMPALPAGKGACAPRAPLDRKLMVKRIRTNMITNMITNPCRFLIAAIVLFSPVIIARAQQSPHRQSPHMNSGYIPHRVYKSGDKRFSDFEAMLAELSRADVAFVGEQHNDPATHRIERAILEGLARRRENVIVAMEMFERDTQPSLDDYLAGRLSEEEFLKASRPWPNYPTDYRPLIEFSRAHRWKVIASNAPRPIAQQVSKQGLDAARSGDESQRKLVAAEFACPMDDYFKRFAEAMGKGHPGAHHGQQEEKTSDKK